MEQVRTARSQREDRELDDLRLILFSDLHKGARDGADDFQPCEAAYRAALAHYWRDGYELLLLGDIEELWEARPRSVLEAYAEVLAEEQRFAAAVNPMRYHRFVGNHDDLWYDEGAVQKHLGPWLAGHPVREGLRIAVHDRGRPLGELFLVHGHQGSPTSDRLSWLSAPLVRYVWRPIQRAFNIRSSTPSNDFELRRAHERAMYDYAATLPGTVLIAGHTHHPVWEGLGFEQALRAAQHRGQTPPVSAWTEQEVRQAVALPGKKPCYFNTGCCCYGDKSITGIEIADGEIRLVRWEHFAQPVRTVFFSASLARVLAAVAA
ncbi:MAG: metallophosphoesterase [Caldilineales bacterium]|nr:metallophosphoesterase [Caldilineales bacterium]MDW8319505.1 metallophosphoesterase [Anaerolineae bacterium]